MHSSILVELKKIVLLAFMLVLLSTAIIWGFTRPVEAQGTIYIRANGSIEPSTANITSTDNVTYYFTDNNYDSIVVERDNIAIDGTDYTLQGTGAWDSKGLLLSERSNVTIKNMNINDFYYGICFHNSSSSTITRNNMIYSNIGIEFLNSSNNSVSENNIKNCAYDAIVLKESSNNTISGNAISANSTFGVWLWISSNNTISGNNITQTYRGIEIELSSHNTISGNYIAYNEDGIGLHHTSNNRLFGNNVTANNNYGIRLGYSSNNILRDNTISNNKYNFWIGDGSLSDFINDIDSSNTVDGQAICYWINKQDLDVPSEAGYVCLINCTRITVQNLNLTKNKHGIVMVSTTYSTITKNYVTDNYYGMWLSSSSGNSISENIVSANLYCGINLENSPDNTIFGNNVSNNDVGIHLSYSLNNKISRNNVTANNDYGIEFFYCANNTIYGNNVQANDFNGIGLYSSANNTFYHNNFVNNSRQILISSSDCANFWDNGFEGNYWSNYNGTDANQDGTGDSPYTIDANNQDNYPLMGMFYDFRFWDVNIVISNSTIHQFSVGYHMNSTTGTWEKCIMFHVLGTEGTLGFCRVMIPREFMESPYNVLVNNEKVNATELSASNNTHVFLYFTYTHSGIVMIIPEFPSWTSMLLLLIVLTVALTIYKRRLLKNTNTITIIRG